jgi:hypothetical protein
LIGRFEPASLETSMTSPALRRLLVAGCCQVFFHGGTAAWADPQAEASAASVAAAPAADYAWTTDHLQIGVRWQPFAGRPQNNAFDAARPVIATDSSYAQFWVAWNAAEPTVANTDYEKNPSGYLQTIEQAVAACLVRGLQVEFVFFGCPAWASASGVGGLERPKDGLFADFMGRIARHFKGRVAAYQLSHEVNLQGMMRGGDVNFLIKEIFIAGARQIRAIYAAEPARPVLISTSGMSPCENCGVMAGLSAKGGRGVDEMYNRLVASAELMQLIDGLNLNVSDQNDGYGCMDGSFVPSVWGNFDLVRGKLDAAGFSHKGVLAAESWVSWDDGGSAVDVNGDGIRDERDAFAKTVTIMGHCLQRGLNTLQLPWSDNSSGWAMGLTKRRDYNGRLAEIAAAIVIPASDGGPGIVTQKLALHGGDESFSIAEASGNTFTVDNYINPSDPNHLHYYAWRWFAQLAAGADEVIRHAVAGEVGNDIAVIGPGFTGNERYRIAGYNRSRETFTVLLYASGANGRTSATVRIPSTVQTGRHANTGKLSHDFRGEGFVDGTRYRARIVTNAMNDRTGADENRRATETAVTVVSEGSLVATVPGLNRFTRIEFVREAGP